MIKIGIGKKIIFWCIWTVLLLEFFGVGGRVWAEKVVSFEQVSEKLEAMIREVQTKQSRISEKKLLMLQKKNSQEICHYRHDGDFIIMSPLCFLSSMKLDFDYKRAIDLVWNDIEGFEESYDMSAQEFEYQSTRPILSKQKNSIDMLYQKRLETKFLMNLLQSLGYSIRLHKKTFAYEKLGELSRYAVKRDMRNWGRCSKTNYLLAIGSLDGILIQPGEYFNINKTLDKIDDYCTGQTKQDLMFYGGVCGASTQLFRLSLLMPDMEVTKRSGHSQRYVRYYSDYIFGDDAAVYQMNKQLEVKNNGSQEVYLRTRDGQNEKYLIGISPALSTKKVVIERKQTGVKSAEVTKFVYSIFDNQLIGQQNWISSYTRKNYDGN